jgi:hypothetical protein
MATSAFGKAFRAARDSGDKEFEYEGKKYNTKLKEEDSAPAKKAPKSSSDEDMSPTKANALKINGASTDSARDTDSLKTTSLKNKPAPAAAAAPAAKTSTDFTPGKVPSSEQAAANRAAAVDKVKSVAGSIGDYFSNFKTPAERRSDEAKQSTGMKKGGSVSASSRGDGIAQRGKTRGKMC